MESLLTTLVSIWTWTVLGTTLLIWLPILALMRLVLAPFDRGHFWTGLFFRQAAVITATLNPYWRFRTAGNRPADPRRHLRRRFQPRIVRRHPSH